LRGVNGVGNIGVSCRSVFALALGDRANTGRGWASLCPRRDGERIQSDRHTPGSLAPRRARRILARTVGSGRIRAGAGFRAAATEGGIGLGQTAVVDHQPATGADWKRPCGEYGPQAAQLLSAHSTAERQRPRHHRVTIFARAAQKSSLSVHRLQDRALQVLSFLGGQQDRVIGGLGAKFHEAELSPGVGCCGSQHLDESRGVHMVRA
jgi:hypothetical protein